jgi:hypothetical protein
MDFIEAMSIDGDEMQLLLTDPSSGRTVLISNAGEVLGDTAKEASPAAEEAFESMRCEMIRRKGGSGGLDG